ncbi:MAG TPA: DUF998 domain-containing protein [Lactobacillus sp.]|nr:DUF998 domain-containing protein [Lactobacillus sp.]
MKSEVSHHITIPTQVVDHLNIKSGDKLQLTLPDNDNQQITVRPDRPDRERQILPIRWFLLPSLLVSILFFAYMAHQNINQIALAGNNSIASAVIVLGIVSGSLSFMFFYFKQKREIQRWLTGSLYWRSFPTLWVSFMIILTTCLLGFFWFAGILFKGATFDQFTSTFMFFLFISLINYLMILSVSALSVSMIFTLLVSVIVGGVLSSMITNSNKRWWEHNISFLGTDKAAYSWQFNLTLIVSALLTVALVDFIFSNLRKQFGNNRRLLVLRILLTLTAVCLGGVGAFANNGRGLMHELHDQTASFMVYFMIITIVAIRYLLPKMTPEFLALSYIIAGLLIGTTILFQPVGYLSLTAYELIAFIMSFSWMLLLLQALQRMLVHDQRTFTVTVE